MKIIKYTFILVLLLLNISALANNKYDQAVLITDLVKKHSMGFTESDVVYELLNQSSLDQTADINAIQGMGTIVRIGYMGIESEGRTSNFAYGTASGSGGIFRTSASEQFTDILLDLPDGADFDFVRIWGRDTDVAQDMTFFLFERCLPDFSAGVITSTTLGSVISNTSAGDFSVLINISADNITINSSGCTYTLRTRFNITGNALRLYKVRAEYQTF
jgi:hypothetical protein